MTEASTENQPFQIPAEYQPYCDLFMAEFERRRVEALTENTQTAADALGRVINHYSNPEKLFNYVKFIIDTQAMGIGFDASEAYETIYGKKYSQTPEPSAQPSVTEAVAPASEEESEASQLLPPTSVASFKPRPIEDAIEKLIANFDNPIDPDLQKKLQNNEPIGGSKI